MRADVSCRTRGTPESVMVSLRHQKKSAEDLIPWRSIILFVFYFLAMNQDPDKLEFVASFILLFKIANDSID